MSLMVGMSGFEPAPPAPEGGLSCIALCADPVGRHPRPLFDGYAAEEASLGLQEVMVVSPRDFTSVVVDLPRL